MRTCTAIPSNRKLNSSVLRSALDAVGPGRTTQHQRILMATQCRKRGSARAARNHSFMARRLSQCSRWGCARRGPDRQHKPNPQPPVPPDLQSASVGAPRGTRRGHGETGTSNTLGTSFGGPHCAPGLSIRTERFVCLCPGTALRWAMLGPPPAGCAADWLLALGGQCRRRRTGDATSQLKSSRPTVPGLAVSAPPNSPPPLPRWPPSPDPGWHGHREGDHPSPPPHNCSRSPQGTRGVEGDPGSLTSPALSRRWLMRQHRGPAHRSPIRYQALRWSKQGGKVKRAGTSGRQIRQGRIALGLTE